MNSLVPSFDLSFPASLEISLDELKSWVIRHRDDIVSYIQLGVLLRWRGHKKAAFELHYNLLAHSKLKGDLPGRLHLEIGFDLLELEKNDLGLSYFEKAALNKNYRMYALEGMALAYLKLNSPELAAKPLDELAKNERRLSAATASAILVAARSLRVAGETKMARTLLERLKNQNRASDDMLLELSKVYLQDQMYDEVEATVRLALKHGTHQSYSFLKILEDVYFSKGEYPKFEDPLRRLLLDFPDNASIYLMLGRHLIKKKKNREAFETFVRGLDQSPGNPELFEQFALLKKYHEGSDFQSRLLHFFESCRNEAN